MFGKFRNRRYFLYCISTIVAFTMPFIRSSDGYHIFLLSFDKKQLHLFFTAFDVQELYLMPFLLIMLFLGIFFMTTLGGRVWCGWLCPQTLFRVVFRDLIETKLLKIRKSISNKQAKPSLNIFKRIIASLIWIAIAITAASNFLWYFVPPEDFFQYLKNPSEHLILIGFLTCIASFLTYDILFLQERFCVYVCPYARVQSTMFDDDTILAVYDYKRGGTIYDENGEKIDQRFECIGCESCVKVCPTHIDIRKGMQLDCINCLECVDACNSVMGKFNKQSLILWTSKKEAVNGEKTKYFRFRTISYAVAILVAFCLLVFMGSKKEYMLLNINRTTELYKIKDNGKSVENTYVFLFQNTDSVDHKYYFEVDNKHIQILRPDEPFVVQAGKKLKKIIVLKTKEQLANKQSEDTILPINITAYAIDEKDKIIIKRDTIFGFPSLDSLQKASR